MREFAWAKAPELIPEHTIQRMETADVVIIGAGHAGTCAARAAAEARASVLVLEQQTEDKQFILGIGEIGHINSRWQRDKGVPAVDIDEFLDDWQTRTGNRSDYRLIRKYAENCGDCFDWFIEPLSQEERDGIHPMLTPQSGHFPKALNGFKAWSGTPNMGAALQNKALKANQRIAAENGARFYFETKALQLIKDGDTVTGAIGEAPGGSLCRFLGRQGVVLATGDYSRNPEMCRDLLAESDDLIDGGDWSGHGWDGSGIRMGVWAGGRLEPRSHAAMGGNYCFPGFNLIGSAATLRVNCRGRHYSNEGFGTHILAATAGARQPNGMLWGIFDSSIADELTWQAPNHAVFDYSDPKELEKLRASLAKAREAKDGALLRDKAGAVRPLYCAPTLEGLAALLFDTDGDRAAFLETVERYNALCARGYDADFGKDSRLLHPIRKAPFYACGNLKDSHKPGGQSIKLLVTVSGLLIDHNQQVLGQDFEPIPGLYATGNCSGCRFGFQYTTSVPGQSISIAQTLGRELGRYLAGRNAQ